jgi:transcriptional regulator with XRE-family HTH domain
MYYFCGKLRKKMNKEITEKIKKMRTARGINQTEMADKLNITRSAYQKIESGESYAWAKYLECESTVLQKFCHKLTRSSNLPNTTLTKILCVQ